MCNSAMKHCCCPKACNANRLLTEGRVQELLRQSSDQPATCATQGNSRYGNPGIPLQGLPELIDIQGATE